MQLAPPLAPLRPLLLLLLLLLLWAPPRLWSLLLLRRLVARVVGRRQC